MQLIYNMLTINNLSFYHWVIGVIKSLLSLPTKNGVVDTVRVDKGNGVMKSIYIKLQYNLRGIDTYTIKLYLAKVVYPYYPLPTFINAKI